MHILLRCVESLPQPSRRGEDGGTSSRRGVGVWPGEPACNMNLPSPALHTLTNVFLPSTALTPLLHATNRVKQFSLGAFRRCPIPWRPIRHPSAPAVPQSS